MQSSELDRRLVTAVPSERQLALEQMEFYAFIHFTVNTFTGKEWGDGTESPSVFDPTDLDADEWARAVKSAGMRGIILTCKHHDGFCLWQTKTTEHSVKNSPYKGGFGDVVKETADACRRAGLKFGVYLSPWDRNCPLYGTGKPYNDFYIAQLEELLTNYGELFAVWLDGACGEGANGKKQVYDFPRIYETVRRLQPHAVISIMGPDVRWCGNEGGHTRESEWSVLPAHCEDPDRVAERSQKGEKQDLKALDPQAEDLGSREALRDATDLVWSPAETDVSIRPGWFYHPEEDEKVRTPDDLFDLYERTVGGNSTLLLNIPPDTRGRFADPDLAALAALGERIKTAYADNLCTDALLSSDDADPAHPAENAKDDNYTCYFTAKDGQNTATVTVTFPEEREISRVVLKENILLSQRIERVAVDVFTDGEYREIASGTTVGYQKIVRFPKTKTRGIRLRVLDSRLAPTLAYLAAYCV